MQYFSNPELTTIVIVTVSDWDEPPRIRHQIANVLANDFNVLFLELPFASSFSKKIGIRRISDRLLILSTGGLPKGVGRMRLEWQLFHDLIDSIIAQKINTILKKFFIHEKSPISLITFQYDFPQVSEIFPWNKKIYICNDDFTERADSVKKRNIMRSYEQEVSRKMDICFGVSNFLVENLKKYNSNTELLLPGHSFDVSFSKKHIKNQINDKIQVSYMGFINNRLRFDWLLHLVSHNDIELHLIGPIEYIHNELPAHEAVNIVGSLYGLELQEYLLNMNIHLMPYVEREALATQAPNKLFQYLASGKPVVTSQMPNLLKLPKGFIYYANSETEFYQKVKKAFYEDNDELRMQRFEIAQNNTWNSKRNYFKKLFHS